MAHGLFPNASQDQESAQLLVRDLERVDTPMTPRPWGPFSSFLISLISFGTLPVLLWHDRFRDFVDEERQHLRRFADWMRLHSSRPETMDLRVSGEELGCRPLLSTLSVLSVLGVIVLFAAHLGLLAGGGGAVVERLLGWTYRFNPAGDWQPPLSAGQKLFAVWGIGLSVAYLFHWLQVQGHASDVRRFVRNANRVLRNRGVIGVPQPRAGAGFAFLWIVAAVFLAGRGAWWGVPMALCGAAQQQYMSIASPRLRRTLAARVRDMARLPVNRVNVDGGSVSRRRCPHVRCLAPMPPGARFCPRCGHYVSAEANSV